jgi:HD-GYP domain-containing protein (c-di-GMP phosphodiesterase class II)
MEPTPDIDFTPIRVATLRGDTQIPFSVHVRVAGKYILYCRSGDSFEGERLARLRAKKLKKMYVKKVDEIPYKQYLEDNINGAYSNQGGKSLAIRAEIIQGFQQAELESFLEDTMDEFSYQHLKSSVQRFSEFIEREPLSLKALLEIPNIDLSISQHSVNVAALSVALAIELNLKQGLPLHLLAMGCMLHDAEHFVSGLDITKLSSMSPKDLAIYKEHPLKGAHRLQGAAFLDQLVVSVITQHEEAIDGSGFPKGLTEKQMDPSVLIAGLANSFERYLSFEAKTPKEALKQVLIAKMGMYPLAHMQALQRVLKTQGLA